MIIRNDNAAQRHSVIFQKLLRGGAVCAGVLMGTAAALAVPEIIKIEPLPDAIAAFKEEAPKVQARLDRGLRFASADQRAPFMLSGPEESSSESMTPFTPPASAPQSPEPQVTVIPKIAEPQAVVAAPAPVIAAPTPVASAPAEPKPAPVVKRPVEVATASPMLDVLSPSLSARQPLVSESVPDPDLTPNAAETEEKADPRYAVASIPKIIEIPQKAEKELEEITLSEPVSDAPPADLKPEPMPAPVVSAPATVPAATSAETRITGIPLKPEAAEARASLEPKTEIPAAPQLNMIEQNQEEIPTAVYPSKRAPVAVPSAPAEASKPIEPARAVESTPALPIPRLADVPLPRPRPPLTPAQELDLTGKERVKAERCLAQAIYFEARAEPVNGQIGVAQVVLNRVFSPYYPGDVCGVVFQNAHRHLSCQFTFACDGKPEYVNEAGAWARAQRIAKQALDAKVWIPEIAKSTHYHATYVRPNWIREMKKMVKVGVHIFYRPHRWGDGADEAGWVKLPQQPEPVKTAALKTPAAKKGH